MNNTAEAVTIYHNPACGTSRNTLALIRNAGVEPTVIEQMLAHPVLINRPVDEMDQTGFLAGKNGRISLRYRARPA